MQPAWMRSVIAPSGFCTDSHRLDARLLENASRTMSVTLTIPFQFVLPGSRRACSTTSYGDFALEDAGTARVTTVLVTRAPGRGPRS